MFYNNVAKIASKHDPDLATLLSRLAKEETLQYAFYRDVIRTHLELESNYCYYIANVIRNFKMRGAVMPNFENRMAVIAKEANYGPLQYFDQVLDVVVDYWGLKDLRSIAPLAEKARIEILEYHIRLKKIRDRFGRFQGKTDLR